MQRSTISDRAPLLLPHRLFGTLEQPAGGREVVHIHIAVAVPASAQVRAFPVFPSPKALQSSVDVQ